jgi:TonB-linked SusC/RagA family outer membrane protein
MRITISLLLVVLFQANAELTHAQSVKISLDLKNVTVEKALSAIEEHSGYFFLYNSKLIDVDRNVSVKAKDKAVDAILDDIFTGTNVQYKLSNKQIILSVNESTATKVSQQSGPKLTGKVVDKTGEALPGTTISIVGSTRGVIADENGNFEMDNVAIGTKLTTMFLGMQPKEFIFQGKSDLIIVLEENINELDEVTVVAFGKQKKESVIAAVSTVNTKDLQVPSSNLTTAFAGKISGLISYQRSGEPGADNADFFIRGVTTFGYTKSPLILIDNVELTTDDLARLQVDDIASFSIMKDATAAALYGSRGANGVILITTKEGKEGKAKLNIRVENSFSAPTSMVKIVDPINYMKLNNEAALTRDPLAHRPYSNQKIALTEQGVNSYVYPAVDWYDELLKDNTTNQRVNLNVSGGGSVAKYYVAGSLTNDQGMLKVDPKNNFNNNINLKRISLRSNVNINLTKTTQLDVRLSGSFEDYNGPLKSGADFFKMARGTSPVDFPKYYVSDTQFTTAIHPLFGNTEDGAYLNPYAEMVKGYMDYSQTVMTSQLELKQALDFITEGLRFRLLGNTTRNSYFDMTRQYTPFYYRTTSYDKLTDTYGLICLNPDNGKDFLEATGSNRNVSTSYYFEGSLNWDRTFARKHELSATAVGVVKQTLYSEATDLQNSLAHRNLGLSGRLTYAYDHRYFTEFSFGYNGSERFSLDERFGFFPSVGAGWMVSNEAFWSGDLERYVTKLKLKGTYGLVGNDAIGDANDRFFYLSRVNLIDQNKQPFYYGEDFTTRPGGTSISRYSNNLITWETSRKSNLGIEIGLFDKIEIQADYFTEYRTNILMKRESIPSTMGLQADLRANVGEASSHGYEISMDVNHSFNKDFWLTGRANFTYATNKYEVYEEPDYPYPWLSSKGLSFDQQKGLIAERLFIDDADVANSPRQTYDANYMPGDIKYMDINDDGVIDDQDIVPIGFPETPRIIYGFGLSTGYKGFDFSFFFQGSAESSFFIDQKASAPFLNLKLYGRNSNNAMLQAWADSHWSEENRNVYALWPRLSTEIVTNNNQPSTWFLRDGSFLRLKSVELGYTLPQQWSNKVHVGSARLYASGMNLLLFSAFKTWDVEMGNNGLGYPVQRVFNIGLNLSF